MLHLDRFVSSSTTVLRTIQIHFECWFLLVFCTSEPSHPISQWGTSRPADSSAQTLCHMGTWPLSNTAGIRPIRVVRGMVGRADWSLDAPRGPGPFSRGAQAPDAAHCTLEWINQSLTFSVRFWHCSGVPTAASSQRRSCGATLLRRHQGSAQTSQSPQCHPRSAVPVAQSLTSAVPFHPQSDVLAVSFPQCPLHSAMPAALPPAGLFLSSVPGPSQMERTPYGIINMSAHIPQSFLLSYVCITILFQCVCLLQHRLFSAVLACRFWISACWWVVPLHAAPSLELLHNANNGRHLNCRDNFAFLIPFDKNAKNSPQQSDAARTAVRPRIIRARVCRVVWCGNQVRCVSITSRWAWGSGREEPVPQPSWVRVRHTQSPCQGPTHTVALSGSDTHSLLSGSDTHSHLSGSDPHSHPIRVRPTQSPYQSLTHTVTLSGSDTHSHPVRVWHTQSPCQGLTHTVTLSGSDTQSPVRVRHTQLPCQGLTYTVSCQGLTHTVTLSGSDTQSPVRVRHTQLPCQGLTHTVTLSGSDSHSHLVGVRHTVTLSGSDTHTHTHTTTLLGSDGPTVRGTCHTKHNWDLPRNSWGTAVDCNTSGRLKAEQKISKRVLKPTTGKVFLLPKATQTWGDWNRVNGTLKQWFLLSSVLFSVRLSLPLFVSLRLFASLIFSLSLSLPLFVFLRLSFSLRLSSSLFVSLHLYSSLFIPLRASSPLFELWLVCTQLVERYLPGGHSSWKSHSKLTCSLRGLLHVCLSARVQFHYTQSRTQRGRCSVTGWCNGGDGATWWWDTVPV